MSKLLCYSNICCYCISTKVYSVSRLNDNKTKISVAIVCWEIKENLAVKRIRNQSEQYLFCIKYSCYSNSIQVHLKFFLEPMFICLQSTSKLNSWFVFVVKYFTLTYNNTGSNSHLLLTFYMLQVFKKGFI